jgi:flagellar biosynthetic protein FlhB
MQQAVIWGVTLAGPGLLLAGTVGLVSGIAQVGFFFSTEALAPKFEKINPATGIKRLFSKLGLIETFKGSLKIGLIAWSTYVVLQNDMPLLISASQNQLVTFIGAVGNTVWEIALRVAGVLLVVAVADYGVQKFEFEKNLRMTHQEMKQELKMAEGDPVIRQRIRQQQKNISQRRMMEKVPKATVVITNPTHFAVALQYEKGENKAPIVVAKGQDFIAQQIKKVAREANVPIVENVELARKLYREVEIGREIPPQLYKAVAEVLAFVYRMHRSRFSSLS